MNAESSAIVVMMGDGNTTVVFLSTPISTRLCRLRSWSAIGLRERLVGTVLADDLPKGRLGNLVNFRLDILDYHNGFLGVHHPVVGNCGNIDAHVVARDDALRLDRLRDDRSDSRVRTSMIGRMIRIPGSRTPITLPSRK